MRNNEQKKAAKKPKPLSKDSNNPKIDKNLQNNSSITVNGLKKKRTNNNLNSVSNGTQINSETIDNANVSIETDIRDFKKDNDRIDLITVLDRFRSRLLFTLSSITVIMAGSFFFSDRLLKFVSDPFTQTRLNLHLFNLIDGFLLRLKVSLVTGILVTIPVIVHQIRRHITSNFEQKEKWFSGITFFASILLFYAGVALSYLTIPLAVEALLSFTPIGINNTIDATEYFNFVLVYCLSMGVVFELPIIVLILTKIGVVSPSFLRSKRKYAIVVIWIVAAVITPTVDPFTQALVAFPLMGLYEVSILISVFVVSKKMKP